MKILLNGTCGSRGEGSWPYYLSEFIECDLVNLSISGAGNAFIHDVTIGEISKRNYDMVLVMWAESRHCSLKVNDISKFSDSKNTSLYQSSLNDWPSKVIFPINDQDYVEKDWICNAGYLDGNTDSVAKFFSEYHKSVSYKQIYESDLIKMISLQNTFKALRQPYVFLYGRPFTKFKRYEHLYKMIDWNNFYTGDTLVEIAKRTDEKSIDPNGKYPGMTGQRYYASLVANQIKAVKF